MNLYSRASYIVNSIFNSITYILPIGSSEDCWLVDCGDVDKVIDEGWNVIGVLLTHAHYDHIYGLNKLISINPKVRIVTNSAGLLALGNSKLNLSHYHDDVEDFVITKTEFIETYDKQEFFTIDADICIKIIQTPGHDSSCVSYIIGNKIYTGDAYIPGLRTVTSFPRSNKQVAVESIEIISQYELDNYIVCPGHKTDNLR